MVEVKNNFFPRKNIKLTFFSCPEKIPGHLWMDKRKFCSDHKFFILSTKAIVKSVNIQKSRIAMMMPQKLGRSTQRAFFLTWRTVFKRFVMNGKGTIRDKSRCRCVSSAMSTFSAGFYCLWATARPSTPRPGKDSIVLIRWIIYLFFSHRDFLIQLIECQAAHKMIEQEGRKIFVWALSNRMVLGESVQTNEPHDRTSKESHALTFSDCRANSFC